MQKVIIVYWLNSDNFQAVVKPIEGKTSNEVARIWAKQNFVSCTPDDYFGKVEYVVELE